jgi:hypothetical protein
MKKHYIPNIEDIHVGYECEIREKLRGMGIYYQMREEEELYTKFFKPVVVGKEIPIPEGDLTIDKFTACI